MLKYKPLDKLAEPLASRRKIAADQFREMRRESTKAARIIWRLEQLFVSAAVARINRDLYTTPPDALLGGLAALTKPNA